MRMPKGLKPGDVVEVDFLDHVEDGEDALRFLVYGVIEKITRQALIIHCWTYKDRGERDHAEEGNIKSFTIVKSAIQDLNILRKRKGA